MLFLLVALAVTLQSPTPVSAIRVSPSTSIDLDLGKLTGGLLLRRLAWSPDGSEIYLMTYDANRDASIKKEYHYLIPTATGQPKQIDEQPEWAATYWTWKSAQASPDDPTLKIQVAEQKKRDNAVALPFGDDLARGGTSAGAAGAAGGASSDSVMEAARAMQTNDVRTLSLKGQVIGEWINHPTVPGQTFGWAPKGTGLIAYAEQKSGKLILMNGAGDRKKIDGTKNVVLPAWTDDGTRLAYLEGRGRNRFVLVVASVQK